MADFKYGDIIIHGKFKQESGFLRLSYIDKIFYPFAIICLIGVIFITYWLLTEPNLDNELFIIICILTTPLLALVLFTYKSATIEIRDKKVSVIYKNIYRTSLLEVDMGNIKHIEMDYISYSRGRFHLEEPALCFETKNRELNENVTVYIVLDRVESNFRSSLEVVAKYLNVGIIDKSGAETITREANSLDVIYVPKLQPHLPVPNNAKVIGTDQKKIIISRNMKNLKIAELIFPGIATLIFSKLYISFVFGEWGKYNPLGLVWFKSNILILLITIIVLYLVFMYLLKEVITQEDGFIYRRYQLGPITILKGKIQKNKIEYIKRTTLGIALCSDCNTLWIGLALTRKDYDWLVTQIYT